MTKTEKNTQNLVSGAIAVMFGVAIYMIVMKQFVDKESTSSACGC
jgi:hypothetical protein